MNVSLVWAILLRTLKILCLLVARNPPRMRKKFIKGPLVMRLQPITNCSNRRFFRFTITHENYDVGDPYVEDLGSIDPMPNKDNQILVALNIERIKYYLAKGVPLKGSVGHYLGKFQLDSIEFVLLLRCLSFL